MCPLSVPSVSSLLPAFTFLSSAEELMAVMALFGFGIGCNMGLYNIVIMEVMGVERLAPVFGTTCFFVAVGFLCTGPFIGRHAGFRDRHISYTQAKSPMFQRLNAYHQFTSS